MSTSALGHFIGGSAVAGTSNRRGPVFNPATGETAHEVSFATAEETRSAIRAAQAAAPAWAATTPLQRARVMFRFKSLLDATHGRARRAHHERARQGALRRARAKCSAASRSSSSRAAFRICSRASSPRASARGIDSWSLRQPLGVVRRHHAVQFPGDGAAVDVPDGARLRQHLRAEAVGARSVAVAAHGRAAEAKPACRRACSTSCNGDKEAVDALLAASRTCQRSASSARRRSREYIYDTAARARQARAGARRREESHGRDAGRRSRPGRRRADGRGVRLGGRTLHGDLGRGRGRRRSATRWSRRLRRDDARAEDRRRHDATARHGSARHARSTCERCGLHRHRRRGRRDAGRRRPRPQVAGHENGFFLGGTLFDDVKPDMRIYKEEIFGPVLSSCACRTFDAALELVNAHEYGNGTAIFTRDGDARARFAQRVQVGMVGINVPIPVPMAFHSFGGWKRSLFGDHARPRRRKACASTRGSRPSRRAGRPAFAAAPSS